MNQRVFEWDASLSVGNEAIDEQHRRLIELVNGIWAGEGSDLEAALEYFLRYTFEHFSDEETLMEEAGYPGLEDHRALHAELSDRIDVSYRSLLAGNLEAAEFRALAFAWVAEHIQGADREFGEYLASRAA